MAIRARADFRISMPEASLYMTGFRCHRAGSNVNNILNGLNPGVRMPRRFAVAAITILAMGAGAAPALAAGPTPLVRTIEKVQIGTDLTLNENLHTAAGDRKAIQVLVANAYAREQATNLVARIPAIPVQQAGKAEWLSGVREGVPEDVQIADAVFAILSGDKGAGWQEIDSQALNAEENRHHPD